MIAVIDYKAGNLTSVMKALHAVGADAIATSDSAVVVRADKIVLPGVGHFSATAFLEEHGLKEATEERMRNGIPFLGICVGLQWLFEGSTESPGTEGLKAFAGCCERFGEGVKVPHVGWNSIAVRESRLLRGVSSGEFVYFTHSYRAPVVNGTVAVTEYDLPFTAAVERDNVMGVQFHPEKSGTVGLRILENFVRLP
ncbi:imidazole glycerol phosphate synthase subunit HisH [Alloacidobacterium dinghuense]|uniref:Imidazole glycerol phosphate synthase subunit HisH n=1 Tax=Alloacidobacterium dinghuense TaxID=2763107 RepID=A0A7G8BEU1_9BACT|nr:imidazole glycerol phosphate synthase subunit HisH [Alloacidobacterium dinghuense]QNI31061.1 imidazole glycerol phosphate synthase subunit HisH [Alloacidobacterium dinghuense]